MPLKEFAQKNNIKILNFPELDEIDEQTAFKTVKDNFERISKIAPEFEMTVQAKEFGQEQKKGARRQHEVHWRVITPKKRNVATSTEWNFISALQESGKELLREILKASEKK